MAATVGLAKGGATAARGVALLLKTDTKLIALYAGTINAAASRTFSQDYPILGPLLTWPVTNELARN